MRLIYNSLKTISKYSYGLEWTHQQGKSTDFVRTPCGRAAGMEGRIINPFTTLILSGAREAEGGGRGICKHLLMRAYFGSVEFTQNNSFFCNALWLLLTRETPQLSLGIRKQKNHVDLFLPYDLNESFNESFTEIFESNTYLRVLFAPTSARAAIASSSIAMPSVAARSFKI